MMSVGFAHVVEDVKQLRIDEKEELFFLLQRYLVEERRQKIYDHYQQSAREVREHAVRFSSNIQQLQEMMAE